MFQATREAAAAYSDLHRGRLGEVNKERSSDVDCEEAKLVKSDGKSSERTEGRGQQTRARDKRAD